MRFKEFILLTCCIRSLPKALQGPCHPFRKRQVFCIEPLDLIVLFTSVFGDVEDVHVAKAFGDPHPNLRVTQEIKRISLDRVGIDLPHSPIQQGRKSPLYHFLSRGAAGTVR